MPREFHYLIITEWKSVLDEKLKALSTQQILKKNVQRLLSSETRKRLKMGTPDECIFPLVMLIGLSGVKFRE